MLTKSIFDVFIGSPLEHQESNLDAPSPSREIMQRETIGGILESTGDPAYSVDEGGLLSGWNRAAERLLGHSRESVLGLPCHEIMRGTDIYGNHYCDAACPLLVMSRRDAPFRHFEMDVRTRENGRVRVLCFPLRVPQAEPTTFSLIHLLRPADMPFQPLPGHEANAGRPLTTREIMVLQLLADNHTTAEIAAALSISPSTVRKHIQNIFEKLDVHTRLSAVMTAFEKRLL